MLKSKGNVDLLLASSDLLGNGMLFSLLQVQVIYPCILQRINIRINT